MMKQFLCLTLALALLAGLAGCAATPSSSDISISSPVSAPGEEPIETPAAAEPLYPHGQLRFYDGRLMGMNWFSYGMNTRHGFYELAAQRDPTADPEEWVELPTLMMLTDYATRQCAPLCSLSGCAHRDESCTAWLPKSYSQYGLVETDGCLLLVDRGYENVRFDEETGERTHVSYEPAIVYIILYDGQNRVELCRLPEGVLFQSGFATDDTYLYATIRSPTEEKDGNRNYDPGTTIVKINLASGEMTELCKLNVSEEMLEGGLDGKLLLRSIDSSIYQEKFENDEAAWEENIRTNHVIYYTIDTDTGERTLLPGELPNIGLGGTCQVGEYMYYNAVIDYVYDQGIRSVGPSPQPVYRMNLTTGETVEWVTFEENMNISTLGIVDNHMLVTVVENTENTGTESSEAEVRNIWIDMETKEQHELQLYYNLPEAPYPRASEAVVWPSADAGDYYLVNIGVIEDPHSVQPVRALILKEDYWAGQANYIPIVNIE